jgi:hypothetical protein
MMYLKGTSIAYVLFFANGRVSYANSPFLITHNVSLQLILYIYALVTLRVYINWNQHVLSYKPRNDILNVANEVICILYSMDFGVCVCVCMYVCGAIRLADRHGNSKCVFIRELCLYNCTLVSISNAQTHILQCNKRWLHCYADTQNICAIYISTL